MKHINNNRNWLRNIQKKVENTFIISNKTKTVKGDKIPTLEKQ